jgi:hypothetical protein
MVGFLDDQRVLLNDGKKRYIYDFATKQEVEINVPQ